MNKSKIFGSILAFATCVVLGFYMGNQPVGAQESNGIVTLTPTNHVALSGPISGESVSKAMIDLAAVLSARGDAKYPIYLVLDTPGGSVLAGFRLHEFLKPYTGIKTITLNSYSMGAFLAEMIQGERLMVETGTLMFHRMRTGVNGVTVEQLESQGAYSKSLEQLAERKVSERSGISVDVLHAKFSADWYMQASEAIENNLMDRIVTVKCNKELLSTTETVTVQPLPFLPPVEVTISKCPLML